MFWIGVRGRAEGWGLRWSADFFLQFLFLVGTAIRYRALCWLVYCMIPRGKYHVSYVGVFRIGVRGGGELSGSAFSFFFAGRFVLVDIAEVVWFGSVRFGSLAFFI